MKADEFIREVDEAVRQDKWLGLWKRYGSYMIGTVLAVVLGTAAGVGWREWQAASRAEEARRYAAAADLLREERPAEAAAAFAQLSEEADGGYAVLARLRAAGALGEAGDEEARHEVLTRLATEADGDLYRELSRLLLVQQQLEQDAGAVIQEAGTLAQNSDPWRFSALELEALAQMRAGEWLAARRSLTALVDDPATPANLSRRAGELLASLGGPVDEQALEDGDGSSP